MKTSARHDELAAIEWKPLWGKPAIFAAVILVLFLFTFKDGSAGEADEKNHGQEAVGPS